MPTLTMDDGVQINYRVDDLTKPWEKPPDTILLVHRHLEHMEFLNPLTHQLCTKFRVVRMDMRGRGKSTAPPEGKTLSGGPDESTLFERQAKDALALMDHLDIVQFHYCGAGGGGMTGMVASIWYPKRVKSLTLIGSPCKVPDHERVDWLQGEETLADAVNKLGAVGWIRQAWWAKALDRAKANPAFAEWNLAQREKLPQRILTSCMTGALLFNMCHQVKEIKVPTLILHEEKNKAVDLEQQHFMHQQIPNSKIVIYEGMELGLHTITPERCAADVIDFIQSLS
jgi:pimeloyl-ACP methyl ester carboxylesterase